MAWFKVDDHFWGHPKRLACTLPQIGLWVTAGSWSAQQLTDGHIPRHVLAVFGAKPKEAAGLVAAGLWMTAEDGWQFHDWHLFQPSRAEVLKTRDEAAARKKAWRDKKAGERAGNADVPPGHARDTSAAERPRDVDVPGDGRDCPTYPDPDPTRPDPDPNRSSLREEPEEPTAVAPRGAKTKRATSIPDDFPPDGPTGERLWSWALEHCPAVPIKVETDQWLDYHRAKGDTAKDWAASWRTWMRNAQKYAERNGGRTMGQLALAPAPNRSEQRTLQNVALIEHFRQQETGA